MISDAPGGINAAITQVVSDATWQRCRTHYMANLASLGVKGNWPMIASLVRSIFVQPDRETIWAQLVDVVDKLTGAGFNDVVDYFLDAAEDFLAFSAFPTEHWAKIRSGNSQKRLNKEIRRRADVIGIFPNRQAVLRLAGALLAEQTDEWAANDPRPAIDSSADRDTDRRRKERHRHHDAESDHEVDARTKHLTDWYTTHRGMTFSDWQLGHRCHARPHQ